MTWVPLPINVADAETWKGVALRYWTLDTYLLPVAEWDSNEDEQQADGQQDPASAPAAAAAEASAEPIDVPKGSDGG